MDPRKAAERQILKAQAEGQLDNLKGAGKPLPNTTGDTDVAAGFRIMAEAGALPEEIILKKQLDEALAALPSPEHPDYKSAMAKLADLQMRHAIAIEARRKFDAS